MKSSAIVCAIAAATLSLGSLSAFAQGRVYDRNASNNPEIYRQTHPEDAGNARNLQGPPQRGLDRNFDRGERRNDRRDDRRNFDRRDDRRDYGRHDGDRRDFNRNYDRGQYYYYGARSPEFRRGVHIPRQYYNRQYYVNDWRGHQLYAPPYGHQWVQVGGDYVLIALATGLIVNLILNQ